MLDRSISYAGGQLYSSVTLEWFSVPASISPYQIALLFNPLHPLMELNKKTFLQCNSGRLSLPPPECGRSAVPSLLGVPATDIVTDPDKPSSLPLSSSSCSHFSN